MQFTEPENVSKPAWKTRRVRILVIGCTVALLAGAGAYYYRASLNSVPTAERNVVQAQDDLDAAQAPGGTAADPEKPVQNTLQTRRSSAATAVVPPPGPIIPSSPAAEQAMARLTQLSLQGPLTPEQATAVQHDLQRLVAEGSAAIPSIRQFLDQNQDLRLDEIKGGSRTGFNSLRAGLFDALRQIDGQEAQVALMDVLRSTADPAEVKLLARHLDALAPGVYRDDFLNAARETLAHVSEAKIKTDVGPLFQVLQNYGGSDVVHDVQQSMSQWRYYGLLTLAGMPDGQGVPGLIQQAQQLDSRGRAKDSFAVQMLAQMAPAYPEASAALLEQARAGQIPDGGWRRIADALAGEYFQFADAAGDRLNGGKLFRFGNTDENLYSLPRLAENDLAPRRALIDELLAATSSPAAVAALEKAQAQLNQFASAGLGR